MLIYHQMINRISRFMVFYSIAMEMFMLSDLKNT